ncbi:carbohydrate ABC transporter permease [Paenarthrobacter sp. FR1]|uniref:carbohydrate ABC transporter permease n=1 Tax=Paenarthrobacter sp. FR1 TaxID=3439548 RepID=UPI003DA281C0
MSSTYAKTAPAAAPRPESTTRRRPRTLRRTVGTSAFYAGLTLIAVLFLAPLVWSAWRSVTGEGAAGFSLDNYFRLFNFGEGLPTYAGNSLLVTGLTVLGTLVASTLAGYGFARFSFPGKNLIFFIILAILMVPHPTILIPLFKLLSFIGLQNSLLGLSLVMIMFQLPFSVFMMTNAFENLPRELEESAFIDGCSRFQALIRVQLPLTVPGMVTVGIFAFLASWNEFMAPLILLNDGSTFTLPVALVNLRSGDFGTIDIGALQAGVVMTALPCLVVFLLLQKFYIRGFTSGAVKG